MANPPSPQAHTATTTTPITHGTVLSYGVEDLSITGMLIDSYKRSGKYASSAEVMGQNGIVQGVRMSDFRAEVSVSGRVLAAGGPTLEVGDILAINGDNILITSLDLSASATGFAQIDISGTAYEGVTGLGPA